MLCLYATTTQHCGGNKEVVADRIIHSATLKPVVNKGCGVVADRNPYMGCNFDYHFLQPPPLPYRKQFRGYGVQGG